MKKLIKLATVAMLCGLFAVFATGCSSSSNSSVSSSGSSFSSIAEPEQKAVDLSSRYILVIGDDSWEDYKPGRADLMMLMRLDFQKHQISLVTVPRDTKYTTSDGTVEKLNQVYCDSGAAAQCKAVSEITGVEVSDYVCVGFDGLQSIVESFGGLNIDLPYSLDYSFYTKDYPNEQFEAGSQTLTPWRAAALARTRTSYGDYNLDQDMMRQLVNRRMMASLIGAAYADPSKTGSVLEALQGAIDTNISVDDQVAWANALADGADEITIYGTSGPFDGDVDAESNLFLVTYDPDNWHNLMSVVGEGDNPSAATAVYAAALQSDRASVCETFKVSVK